MSALKTSVAIVFGAAAMAAAHTGALAASGSGFKALALQPAAELLPEAVIAPASRSAIIPEWFCSGALAGNGAYFPPTLRFRPGAGSLELAFGIDQGGPVTLEAFDARGNLVATLLDGERQAGFHRLSVFSNRLQGKTGQVFFRLRAGGAVLAEMRAASR